VLTGSERAARICGSPGGNAGVDWKRR